ncbi:MAG: glycosyltransferase [Gemmatimonadaceae bacterium]
MTSSAPSRTHTSQAHDLHRAGGADDSPGEMTGKMHAPLVSVVIPCYGEERYLDEAIESVRSQSYPHYEIIVVADGSPGSHAVIAGTRPDVRYVEQPHQGVSVARNLGVSASRGEYLVFLDADDRLLRDALTTGVAALKAHPDAAFVYGRAEWMAADGSPLPTPKLISVARDHYLALLRTNFIAIHTAMHRRSAFEAVRGFRAGLHMAEDYELYLRLARRYAVHEHGELVAQNRRHGSSASRKAAAMLAGSLGVLRAQLRLLPSDERYEEALRAGVAGMQAHWGGRLADQVRAEAHANQWRAASRGALALLRYHPWGFASNAFQALRQRMPGRRQHVV